MLRVSTLSFNLLSVVLLSAIACSSSSGKDDNETTAHGGAVSTSGGTSSSSGGATSTVGTISTGGTTSYASRRTPTCLAVQKAICDYEADKCGDEPRADCDEFYSYFFCAADSVLTPCITALSTADCTTFPTACSNVLDPTIAQSFCQDELIELCRDDQACSGIAPEVCFSNSVNQFCDPVLGVGPTGDACLSDLKTWDCNADPPANCKGILLEENAGGAGG